MNEIYKIETLEDFLKVPEDRLDICFSDFRDFLGYLRFHTDMKIAAIMGVPEGSIKTCPVFNWCDNGKHGISKLLFFVNDGRGKKQVGEINISDAR